MAITICGVIFKDDLMFSWAYSDVISSHEWYTSKNIHINVLYNKGFEEKGVVVSGNDYFGFAYNVDGGLAISLEGKLATFGGGAPISVAMATFIMLVSAPESIVIFRGWCLRKTFINGDGLICTGQLVGMSRG